MRQAERVPGRLGRIVADRRRARFRALLSEVRTRPGMTVLDLGCGRTGRSTTDHAPHDWRITGIDRLPEARVRHAHPGFRYVRGDACDLSAYADDAFDLVLAVGLLEHVVEPSAFLRACTEIRRVGRQYALVVPYRYAWIEPHYLVPLFPVLPRPVQNGMVRAFDIKGHGDAVARDPGFLATRTVWRPNDAYRAAFPEARVHLSPTRETVLITYRGGATT